jgi:hypothetical protein
MPDVFISYSSQDSILAEQFRVFMVQHGIDVFLAAISIEPGSKWKESIIEALNQSRWVFFLATPSACTSQAVMHELGGALFTKKKIISVLCGVAPGQLPEWVRDRQAIDLEEKDQIVSTVEKIADAIRSDKFLAGLVAGGLVLFALWLVFGGRNEEG